MTTDIAGLLDAEYREFVRALHVSTVATYTAVSAWYPQNACRLLLGKVLGEQAISVEDVQTAVAARAELSAEVYPQLAILINGHPDPDVRDCAQMLSWRTGAVNFVVSPLLRGNEFRFDLDFARRVYEDGDALRRLRRAVREAPFRVHRPPSPSTRERYPEDRSLEDFPETFFAWFDRVEQRERDYRPTNDDGLDGETVDRASRTP